jgi:hypothetical protein
MSPIKALWLLPVSLDTSRNWAKVDGLRVTVRRGLSVGMVHHKTALRITASAFQGACGMLAG